MSARDFLASRTAGELPRKRESVIEASVDMALLDAFRLLVTNHVQAIPVWDPHQRHYVGWLTVRDLVSFAVYATKEKNAAANSLEDILRNGGGFLMSDAISVAYLARRNPFRAVLSSTPLLAICDAFVAGERRVPILDANGRCANVISPSLINEFLLDHAANIGPLTSKSVGDLGPGTRPLTVCRDNASALDAFELLDRSQLSGIGLVNVQGQLNGVFSGSDLKLYLVHPGSLNQPIFEFLKVIRQMDLKTRSPTFVCRSTDSLAHVMGSLRATLAHRLFLIDEQGHPLRAVSLRDIIRAALTC